MKHIMNMKRLSLIMVLIIVMVIPLKAQRNTIGKITPDLQNEISSKSFDEDIPIIIVMSDKYDHQQIEKQIQFLGKKERRAFVIDELQRFSKTSQYDLLQLLEEGTKSESVTDVKSFWLFNGISCTTNRNMIEVLAQRNDIALIDLDRIVMLPDNEKPIEAKELSKSLAWHVSQVHADNVWNYNGTTGYDGTGVIVAIIDTGVNYNHTDLQDHMWDGGTDYPNHGYDFYSDDKDPMDEHGHGSHCAGITAGDGTSGTQTGIAPNASIMALKVFGASGGASTNDILDAMSFAVEHGADVVSMSLGASGAGGYYYYRQAFDNMMSVNVVASVAAGNDGEDYGEYSVPTNIGSPGNCPSPWHNPDQTLMGGQSAVVTVGASNRNDRKTTFSSFGPVTWSDVNGYADYPYTAGSSTEIGLIKPDIIAPGADIVSCNYSNNNGYVIMMGTSMATPLVSGIMALMLDANPNLTPAQIDEILETTALPVDYRVSKNNLTGAGRADALTVIDAIFTQATQPTNLILETCGGNVSLNWTASTAPNGYCIYRDNEQIGSTSNTTFTDTNAGTGQHVYYVRANDNNGHQSVRSNAVLCYIEPYASIPEDLTISWNGNDAILDWDASTASNTLAEANLSFVNSSSTSYVNNSDGSYLFWGIRFLPEELRPYLGMSIDRITVGCRYNREHTIRIYRGSSFGNTTGEAVCSQSFTPTSNGIRFIDVTLDNPYQITDISEDLWIVCSTLKVSGSYPAVAGAYSGHNSCCFYLTSGNDPNSIIWSSVPDGGSHYAACINAHLTRTTTYTPTYNVYYDNNNKASDVVEDTYTDATATLHSGENTYYLTSKIGNNESCPSNDARIIVVNNAQTENEDIVINSDLVYLINPTGILTANGELSSADPSRLILEDGAQLVNNSTDVQATVKKDIAAYTAGERDGWYLIASPILEGITPTVDNGLLTNDYDLYIFDQSAELEWRNYKTNPKPFTSIENKTGYLYANSGNPTLVFSGTLAANVGSITLTYDDNASFKGFNLIGNPYPCETYVTGRSFYIVQKNATTHQSEFILGDNPVPPCTAILVQTTAEEVTEETNTVTFSKTAPTTPSKSIDISVTKANVRGNTILDKTRVSFDESDRLLKYNLNENSSRLYIPMGGQDLAVAYANGEKEMPINFKTAENGTFTLAIEIEDLDLDYLHLIDNMTGDDVDLLASNGGDAMNRVSTYTFEAKTTDYASRFRLVFAPQNAEDDNETFAYVNNGEIVITDVETFQETSLQVVDLTGRIVLLGDAMNRVSTEGLTAGVYVLRLITTDGVKTQKIVIE